MQKGASTSDTGRKKRKSSFRPADRKIVLFPSKILCRMAVQRGEGRPVAHRSPVARGNGRPARSMSSERIGKKLLFADHWRAKPRTACRSGTVASPRQEGGGNSSVQRRKGRTDPFPDIAGYQNEKRASVRPKREKKTEFST